MIIEPPVTLIIISLLIYGLILLISASPLILIGYIFWKRDRENNRWRKQDGGTESRGEVSLVD